MNCGFCDTDLALNANFCNRCGNAIAAQSGRLAKVSSGASSSAKSDSWLVSMMRSGLAARIVFSTAAYGLLGLWAGSILPLVDATTLGALGAAYGALRKI